MPFSGRFLDGELSCPPNMKGKNISFVLEKTIRREEFANSPFLWLQGFLFPGSSREKQTTQGTNQNTWLYFVPLHEDHLILNFVTERNTGRSLVFSPIAFSCKSHQNGHESHRYQGNKEVNNWNKVSYFLFKILCDNCVSRGKDYVTSPTFWQFHVRSFCIRIVLTLKEMEIVHEHNHGTLSNIILACNSAV